MIIFLTVILFLVILWSICMPSYVVSLTTIPSRLEDIGQTIRSLEMQVVKPQKIILNIPEKYNRFKETVQTLPDFITNNPLVYVNKIREDYGPATKMLGILELDLKPSTVVLICDDDVNLYPHWSLVLLSSIFLNPRHISSIGPHDHRMYGELIFGNGGWGFYRNVINKNDILKTFHKNKEHCLMVDDNFFSEYFNNIITLPIHYMVMKDTHSKSNDALMYLRGDNSRKETKKRCLKNFNK